MSRPGVLETLTWECPWCCEPIELDVRSKKHRPGRVELTALSGDLRHPISCTKFGELEPHEFIRQSVELNEERGKN